MIPGLDGTEVNITSSKYRFLTDFDDGDWWNNGGDSWVEDFVLLVCVSSAGQVLVNQSDNLRWFANFLLIVVKKCLRGEFFIFSVPYERLSNMLRY